LKEASSIEIHDINKNKIVSQLKLHTDMIDSLLKLELPEDKTKISNPYIKWLLSASRDRTIILWKLIDGKIMKRN
jgi:WD40 repeat protein